MPLEYKQAVFIEEYPSPVFENITLGINIWDIFWHFNNMLFEYPEKECEEKLREILEKIKKHVRDSYGYFSIKNELKLLAYKLVKISQKELGSINYDHYIKLATSKGRQVTPKKIEDMLKIRYIVLFSFSQWIENSTKEQIMEN